MSGVTSEYVWVGGVLTRYSWIGGDIDSKPKRVIIVIPGNPGLCGFYETLMIHLWSSLKGSVDAIWAVSHAGHDPRPADPPFHTNKHSYDLKGQIDHKVGFVERASLSEDAVVTLVGHSMGCYVIIKALERIKHLHAATRGYFLFPMIERMAETPNGSTFMFRHLGSLNYPVAAFAWILNALPTAALDWIVRKVQPCKDAPSARAIRELICPQAVSASLHLAQHEMREITDLDTNGLQAFKSHIRMLYGQTDDWAPIGFYHNLLSVIPGIKAELASDDVPHAFVLHDNEKVAETLVKWYSSDNSQ